MIQPNRYLKEIGIDKKHWMFSKEDNRYIPDGEGFAEVETWNLDHTLDMFIYSYLRYFKDVGLDTGTPMSYCYDKNGKAIKNGHRRWVKDVDYVIETFKLRLLDIDDAWKELGLEKNDFEGYNKRIKKGMELFIKIYNELWW